MFLNRILGNTGCRLKKNNMFMIVKWFSTDYYNLVFHDNVSLKRLNVLEDSIKLKQ